MVTKQVNSGLEEIRENDMEDKEDVDQYNMDDGGTSLAQSDNTQSTGRASRRGTSLRLSFPLQSNLQDNSDFECTDSLKNTKGRKSMRRQSVSSSRNTLSASSIADGNSMFESIDLAMESLGQGRQNENISVAAAAAVVAGGAAATGKISHIQFSAHEKVLVFVNILNHTNSTDDKEDFTLSPVNKAGFPQGLGDTTTKQKGPWAYVLATVQRVHFDEDFRYYTVVRADTNSPQRADAEWMEPLKSKVGLEAAMAAAAQTGRIKTRESTEKDSHTMSSMMVWFTKVALWPDQFFKTALIPFYRRSRKATKVQVTHLLYGVSPFACKLRITGVNILVLCSFCALFLEVIGHAFLPASYDEALTIVIMVSWTILILELFFEWLIRPSGYFELIQSDKCFAPSTARHINRFHLLSELLALLLFIPKFFDRKFFTNLGASLISIIGPKPSDAAFGRFILGLTALRTFGLVRHWKQMWIHTAFSSKSTEESIGFMGAITVMLFSQQERREQRLNWRLKKKVDNQDTEEANVEVPKGLNEEDERLKKAATIGTALMVVNSHRTMIILMVIVIIFPMILVFRDINPSSENFVDLLLENNVVAKTRCDYLNQTVESWLLAASIVYSSSLTDRQDTSILWAQVLPERCDFQNAGGVITNCLDTGSTGKLSTGSSQDVISSGPNVSYYADILNIRQGGISDITRTMSDNNINYTVRVLINNNGIVVRTNVAFFLLLLSYLLLTIGGLQILQGDAGRLVLDPLQRMLKIVLRYAENPLAETQPLKPNCPKQRKSVINESSGDQASNNTEQLGNYETEQLINAITKIADLLRKCWGVAGAGIISSNLARTQDGKTVVFNPTVPGKRVYALFGFVGISGFGEQLRALDRDVMILINDVAKVVHDEVYRWALGNSGQCNKNLGSTFLMVFRIGDFTDVHERKRVATSLLFESKGKGKAKNTHLKSRHMGLHRRRSMREEFEKKKKARVMNEDDTLQLSTLPGISTFTDRALLGMLKSFAALHRDRAVQNWKKDFRLGAGVGAFSVEILIGMDAGWAVEGAVGSEYKIDATYLSPHVNMAARMMSATKQYGVTLLMSQAVKELLSKPARQQIRHIDTVYVKGSQVKQPIFTYDARHQGVNFFLFERSEEQSDFESESYVPTIWDDDQDLKAMRQHVTTEFANKFASGVKEYLAGRWKAAIETLTEANNIMITTVLDEGYIDYNPDDIDSRIFDRNCSDHDITRMRDELGDGACTALVSYMESRGGIPPANWDAVRPLTSK